MNNWKDGIKRIPLHLASFGAPVGLVVWYGGWSGSAVLVAWRAYEEYQDWRQGRDTLAKAFIDFASQTIIPAVIAIIRNLV